MAIVIAAALVGILFGRFIHDHVAKHQKSARPLLIIAIINASLLALIFCGETAFQSTGWASEAATWVPQQIYLVPAIVLMIAGMATQNKSASIISLLSAVFAAWQLMGLHISPPPASVSMPAIRIMTMDVGGWPRGSAPVIQSIRLTHPNVFCLQNSAEPAHSRTHPVQELDDALQGYHFLREGGITIGTKSGLELVKTIDLPTVDAGDEAIVARVFGDPRSFTMIAVQLAPCDPTHAVHDPTSYFNTFAHARQDQLVAIAAAARKVKGPIVVAGDFNSPPRLVGAQQLAMLVPDTFEQTGMAYNYTSPASFPIVRSDRILAGQGLIAHATWIGGAIGSDHLPVIADVAIDNGQPR